MKIRYTKHAQKKFADLKIFGIRVTKAQVAGAVKNSKYHTRDNGNLISSADFGDKHNLRVVFKEDGDGIIIVTFYIYRKGRYGEY